MHGYEVWRPRVAVAGAVVAAMAMAVGVAWWSSGRAQPGGEPAAAVLDGGFAVTYEAGGRHRVVEVAPDGRRLGDHAIDHAGELRVAGTSEGPAAGWVERGKLRLVAVDGGEDLGSWGGDAVHLCEGVASNDHRFGIGWRAADDRVWFVHGPTARTAVADVMGAASAEPATRAGWCGIASADQNIALFWRDRDRLFVNMCTRRKCGGIPGRIKLDRRDTVLGFGCLKRACLIAARAPDGNARLVYVTEAGAAKWTRPLPTRARSVSIVGAGDRAFAVGYAAPGGAEVVRVDKQGEITRVWHGSGEGVPAVAWSAGRLVVASRTGDAIAPVVISFPR